MAEIKDGGPAFPVQDKVNEWGFAMQPGMSLRDWFAGQAIGAVVRQCANDLCVNNPENLTPEQYFAKKAYNVADAMLAEREKADAPR